MLARFSHFLLPQESNNFRAKILHHSSLSSIFIFFLIFQLFLSSFVFLKPQVLGYSSFITPERIIELTNQERSKSGLPPLKVNPLLSEAALRKAGDMFAFNYWAHSSPSGRDPWAFFKEVGYDFLFAGENLARDFSTSEGVVAAWLASLTHKENLTNPKYQEIGVAVVEGTLGGVQTTLVVQFFGAPILATAQLPQREKISLQGATGQAAGLQTKISFNPFTLTRNLGVVLFTILVVLLVTDGIVAWRKKTLRLTGKTLAHLLFLIGGILLLLISKQGIIL